MWAQTAALPSVIDIRTTKVLSKTSLSLASMMYDLHCRHHTSNLANDPSWAIGFGTIAFRRCPHSSSPLITSRRARASRRSSSSIGLPGSPYPGSSGSPPPAPNPPGSLPGNIEGLSGSLSHRSRTLVSVLVAMSSDTGCCVGWLGVVS